ncbi:conserved hypothetical protein [Rhodoferax ferrireducens T118]|uniref:DUF2384 domain-containing protein n=1 Tax=Albidiferax ferrireducens (strain ATCC BAA-621 / DSM 15236 / T118) TaxID=338969 RepID=Q21Z80_ALBFT|nr:hypothetical protein [Rhodoferax ferrireducens]ABD68923.1 conserved hypothetical protein [Rhodoferax ferrireducens T118]
MTPLAYPKSKFEPGDVTYLSAKVERARLSPSALNGFFNVTRRWRLKSDVARELLGGISRSTFYDSKRSPDRLPPCVRLVVAPRIYFLIGIYKALHGLYGDKLADEWVLLPNRNVLFGGHPPLQYMVLRGLIGMQTVL